MKQDTVLATWAAGAGAHIRRRVRLLMLLDAADYALISPIDTGRLHAFAFLADVLSPLYDFTPLSGRILKRGAGPYFPELQWELDRLIGAGLVHVSKLESVVEESAAFLIAEFSLKRSRSASILNKVYDDGEFLELRDFLRELAGALSGVPLEALDETTRTDVTWETGHPGAVVDYAEWRARNYSEASARKIGEIARENMRVELEPAAKLSLYVQYLKRASND